VCRYCSRDIPCEEKAITAEKANCNICQASILKSTFLKYGGKCAKCAGSRRSAGRTKQQIAVRSQPTCPKCQSASITYNKKGYSATKGLVGGLATGGIGLLAGFIGSNKIKATCVQCGNSWFVG
jgi:hypothetical protein